MGLLVEIFYISLVDYKYDFMCKVFFGPKIVYFLGFRPFPKIVMNYGLRPKATHIVKILD